MHNQADLMKKYAIIVAGGNGTRMGADKPKQFLLLQGKPILSYTIDRFLASFADIHIILVLPADYLLLGQQMLEDYFQGSAIEITTGGATRFHSVQNGLKSVIEPSVVFVHDGVRCLVTTDLIRRCYEQALDKGSAIPAVAATDSIRIVDGDQHKVINRDAVRIIQTPQTFLSHILLPAFEQPYVDHFTDEATVVEANGEAVKLLEGAYENIKITRPADLMIAEQILAERSALDPS
jgi:2-C-methyl-D-erythritol 4-phosphate cytidylyltransferase